LLLPPLRALQLFLLLALGTDSMALVNIELLCCHCVMQDLLLSFYLLRQFKLESLNFYSLLPQLLCLCIFSRVGGFVSLKDVLKLFKRCFRTDLIN